MGVIQPIAVRSAAMMERTVMANEAIQKRMAGYHELLQSGRREVYRIEG